MKRHLHIANLSMEKMLVVDLLCLKNPVKVFGHAEFFF